MLHDLQLGVQVTNLDVTSDNVNIANQDMNPVQTGNCISAANCDATKLLGAVDMHYGRARTKNAFGPETENLPIPLYLEYFDGSHFVLNTDDNFTSYDDDDLNAGSDSTASPDYVSINPSESINAGKHNILVPLSFITPGVVSTINVWWIVDAWLNYVS
jgi:MSHA biogenesis protein MshQ